MYDVDGNGVIDQDEMTKIVQAIYDMLGAGAVKPTDTAEERAKNIFNRYVQTVLPNPIGPNFGPGF
jgi:Ca2+-binding EF-hand superfamily protein